MNMPGRERTVTPVTEVTGKLNRWCFVLAAWLVLSCGDPTGVSLPSLKVGEWRSLGLEGKRVASLVSGDWGLFAGTEDDGLFRYDDGDGSWEYLAFATTNLAVESLFLVPGDRPALLAGVLDNVDPDLPDSPEAVLFRSVNRGTDWEPRDAGMSTPFSRPVIRSLAADPGNPNLLFAGGSGQILKSTDGGAGWEYVVGFPDAFAVGVFEIIVSPRRDGRVWAAAVDALVRGAVMWSDDWGDTWADTEVTPGTRAVWDIALDPRDPDVLWAGTSIGVYRSSDAARTWVEYAEIPLVRGELEFVGNTLYAANDSEVWAINTDASSGTWVSLGAPPGYQGVRSMITSGNNIILGTHGGGVWMVRVR